MTFTRSFIGLILACIISDTLLGATSTDLGQAATSLYNKASDTTLTTKGAVQRVRIPVTMKAWNSIDAKASDGQATKSKIAGKPLTQVLRARLESPNDFYVSDWRIQTSPVRWLKQTGQYQVKLEVFRRFGADGQLEESLGSVLLSGVLEKQSDELYILNGTAQRTFRDRVGEPLLELTAGQRSNVVLEPVARISKIDPAN